MKKLKLFSMIALVATMFAACGPNDKTEIKFKGGREVTKQAQVNVEMSAYTDEVTVTFGKGETTIVADVPAWATFTQTGNKFAITGTPDVEKTEIITISATNNGVTATQTLTINVTDEPVYEEKTIYTENFGSVPTASPWPYANVYDGYQRGGIGGGAVVYEGAGVSIRSNAVSDNNGYSGASGGNNAMMAAAGASLIIKDIATCGARNFKFSFGCNETSEIVSIAYRVYNTTEWVELPFAKEGTYWDNVEGIEFSVPAGTNTISLKFTAAETQYGSRVDDLLLTTEDIVSSPIIDEEEPIVIECDVVDLPVNVTINNAIPDCWTYITNDPAYPDPAFYANGGLRINYEYIGITSQEFNQQSNIKVTINISAFNANTRTAGSADVFTITGYNASNVAVGTAAIQTVAVGDNVINLTGTNIVKVDVIMTGYPEIDGVCQNVNVKGIKIETN